MFDLKTNCLSSSFHQTLSITSLQAFKISTDRPRTSANMPHYDRSNHRVFNGIQRTSQQAYVEKNIQMMHRVVLFIILNVQLYELFQNELADHKAAPRMSAFDSLNRLIFNDTSGASQQPWIGFMSN